MSGPAPVAGPAVVPAVVLAVVLAVAAVLFWLADPSARAVARLPRPMRADDAGRAGRPGGPGWAGRVRWGLGRGSGRPAPADDAGPAVSGLLRVGTSVGAALAVLMVLPGSIGLGAAALAGVVAYVRTGRLETASVRRRRARLEADLPHVVDLLLASVAAGAAPAQALARVAAVSDPVTREELGAWVSRLRLGADPVAVWDDLAGHPQLGRLGVTLRRSAESGAPVVDALLRLSQDLRARRRADVEGRVRQVEVKAAVPLGVCLLPAFVLVGVVPLVAGAAMSFLVP